MAVVTMMLDSVINGRQVKDYRIGYHKVTVTYPEGADVQIEYVGDVREIGERPVLSPDDIKDLYFWDLPVAEHLLENRDVENG